MEDGSAPEFIPSPRGRGRGRPYFRGQQNNRGYYGGPPRRGGGRQYLEVSPKSNIQ